MKRFVAILVCLILLGSITLTATAAGSAHMSISASSTTVHRGDEFTLSITLSNDETLTAGGIVLSYDSSIFELVGGSCHVNDVATADVGNDNSCTFALNADAKVSGTIFTVTLRVKADASFSTYEISGRPSLANAAGPVSCGLSGTSVTVACQHVFANSVKVDDAEHESTCSICGEVQKEAHAWNDGTVTKEATCKEPGSKTLKCTVCDAEKVEEIPVNEDHPFGEWESEGISGHTRVCPVCGVEDFTDHDWYTGDILEEATCQTTGRKSIYCGDCGASAEQEIPLSDHDYSVYVSADEDEHIHKCAHCSAESADEHTFSDELEHDNQTHYYPCQVCGYKKDQADHEPGPAATEETDQVCTVCNRILQPMGTHEHEYSDAWTHDDANHWHDCMNCPVRDSEGPHKFDNACDPDCNTCGMTRPASHTLNDKMDSDKSGHWFTCETCGEKVDFAAHNPGPAATGLTPQLCTVCQFELAPIVVHDHAYGVNGTKHTHKCDCGMEYETDAENCSICAEAHKSFPWWIVCIVEAVAFIVILYVIQSKKKNPYDDDDDDDDDDEDEEEEASQQSDELLKKYLAE